MDAAPECKAVRFLSVEILLALFVVSVVFSSFSPARGADLFDDYVASQNLQVAVNKARKHGERWRHAEVWMRAEARINELKRDLVNTLDIVIAGDIRIRLRLLELELDALKEKARRWGVMEPKDGNWSRQVARYREKFDWSLRNLDISFDSHLGTAEKALAACRLDETKALVDQLRSINAEWKITGRRGNQGRFDGLREYHRRMDLMMSAMRGAREHGGAAYQSAVASERAGDLHKALQLYREAKSEFQRARQLLDGTLCTTEIGWIDDDLRTAEAQLSRLERLIGGDAGTVLPDRGLFDDAPSGWGASDWPPGGTGCREVCTPREVCENRVVCEWKIESVDGRQGLCSGANPDPNNCVWREDCDRTERVCSTVDDCQLVCD